MKSLSLVFSSILISGCVSNIPDESDIKKEIERSFESCSLVEIKDLQKNNGEEIGDKNKYSVSFQYTLNFIVPEESKSLNKERHNYNKVQEMAEAEMHKNRDENYEQIRDLEKQEREEIGLLRKSYSDKIDSFSPAYDINAVNEFRSAADEIRYKYGEAIAILKNEQFAITSSYNDKLLAIGGSQRQDKIMQEIKTNFDKNCKFSTKYANQTIYPLFTNNKNLLSILDGGIFNVTQKKIMKKTENGWVFDN